MCSAQLDEVALLDFTMDDSGTTAKQPDKKLSDNCIVQRQISIDRRRLPNRHWYVPKVGNVGFEYFGGKWEGTSLIVIWMRLLRNGGIVCCRLFRGQLPHWGIVTE
ncbi:hypothetical protein DXH95_07730 [Sphingorhabdus pulchriflava]|uniref:Uncharacterized protein n=1 Tax=Sphingorhabdus pulchriflava TaxID=2292257 RepID=A0A371BI28_9SPHN|nr:hypothetical protein DXH95_07730 [Sphingorhabdus pulchriflava]